MVSHRQLAAILFSDIEGYADLMQVNEQQALTLRERYREILLKEHQQHNGQISQDYGIGTLSTFPSAVEAVLCALNMQLAFQQKPQVPVRMGLHFGDVILAEEIVGDGVNLAARIQSLGVPGSVLVSDKVNNEILSQPDLETVSVGIYQFKNVHRPVEVFALNHADLIVPPPNSLTGKTENKNLKDGTKKNLLNLIQKPGNKTKTSSIQSIAVLPFVNIGNDPEQEYFSDGITEEILNSVTQIKDLKVAGRTSSFQFKGKNLDLREVGNKLHVKTVLEGSVRKQGNRVRITAQLIDVEDGFHLWSERYDREMGDIFAIQDDISSQIAEQLKVNFFGPKCANGEVKKPTNHMEAYNEYLKGRYWLENTVEGIPKAMAHFKETVRLDPDFAEAWCSLGVVYFQAMIYMMVSNHEGMEMSKRCAEKALSLDPHISDAHILLAQVYLYYNLDWKKAGAELELSKKHGCSGCMIKFLPFEPWYRGMIYGDFDFSILYLKDNVDKDPLSIFYLQHLSYLYIFGKRDYPEAREVLKRMLKIDPLESEIWRTLALTYFFEGDYDLAFVFAQKAYELAGGKGITSFTLIICLAGAGKKEEAENLYKSFRESMPAKLFPAIQHCLIKLYMGDIDAAFVWLDKAFRNHNFWLFTLKYSPEWDLMRPDPRFQKFLDKLQLPV